MAFNVAVFAGPRARAACGGTSLPEITPDTRVAASRAMPNSGTATFTGDVSNFTGATTVADAGARIIPFSGSLRIGTVESVAGNDIDDNRTDFPNALYANCSGTVRLSNQEYSIRAALAGQCLGTRIAAGAVPIEG